MKPVAWMFRGYLYEKDPSDWTVHEHPNVPVIPLYTHPAKTLTDRIAELEKELKRTKFAWNLAENELETLKYEKSSGVYDLAKTLTDEEIQEIAHDFEAIGWMGETTYEFARAILKKARE